MTDQCKECQLNEYYRKNRVNYSRLNEAEKALYWENYRKLTQTEPLNSQNPKEFGQGKTIY